MSTILDKIAQQVRQTVQIAKESINLKDLKQLVSQSRQPFDFKAAFQADKINIIAEVKLASPSEGDIAPDLVPVQVAEDYLKHGAVALSILTEPAFFKGSPDYLQAIRQAHPEVRLLMKDFVLDEYQLFQARYYGADAVLLIVALLEKELKHYYMMAKELGLTPLVEVHNQEELELALELGCELIGVNNRNLKTMEITLKTSEQLIQQVPEGSLMISESGIKTTDDILHLKALGYKGFLVGTSLMKTGQPGQALARLLGQTI